MLSTSSFPRKYALFSSCLMLKGCSQKPQSLTGTMKFDAVIRESLFRSNSYKATCPLCRQYVMNNSRRSISNDNLPIVLALNTSIYETGTAAHQPWLDASNKRGPYIQPFVGIRGQVDGVNEQTEVQYELRVSKSTDVYNKSSQYYSP